LLFLCTKYFAIDFILILYSPDSAAADSNSPFVRFFFSFIPKPSIFISRRRDFMFFRENFTFGFRIFFSDRAKYVLMSVENVLANSII